MVPSVAHTAMVSTCVCMLECFYVIFSREDMIQEQLSFHRKVGIVEA